jgi:hypothetical protein
VGAVDWPVACTRGFLAAQLHHIEFVLF